MQVTGTTQRGNDRGIRVVVEMTPEEASLIGGLAKTAVLHMPICEETAANRSRLRSIEHGMRQIQKTHRNPLSPEESYRRACVRYIREKGWKWNATMCVWENPDYSVQGLTETAVAWHLYDDLIRKRLTP